MLACNRCRSTRPPIGAVALVTVFLAALPAGLAGAGPAWATNPDPSPLAEQAAAIKALSPAEIDDLLAGRGMGLAKAAELNGYPGPRHVLDLDAALGLSAAQRARAERLFAEMAATAQDLGRRIVAAEAALEALFVAGAAEPPGLARQVDEIARLQGALRTVHLAAHLQMRRVLSAEQVALYDRLRGYAADPALPANGGHPPEGGHRHGG